jgi:predicted AAA+ superfamily ATPase
MEIKRHLERDLVESVRDNSGVVINVYGLKGCGKSTLLQQIDPAYTANVSGEFDIIETCAPIKSSRAKPGVKNFQVFPISIIELQEIYPSTSASSLAAEMIRFGGLPGILSLSDIGRKRKALERYYENDLIEQLLKDNCIKFESQFRELLRLLAINCGDIIRLRPLANELKLNFLTLKRYMEILIDTGVIFEVKGFKRNLKTEVDKFSKYYFVDCGVRNAAAQVFRTRVSDEEKDRIFQNFVISERYKYISSVKKGQVELFFWSTYDSNSLDIVELLTSSQAIKGFKISAAEKATKSFSTHLWKRTYKSASFEHVMLTDYIKYIKG